MGLFGKDLSFYNLFEAQAAAAARAARTFHELATDWTNVSAYAETISHIEREADEITHHLATKTNRTFVTPLDKEDIRELAGALDDITDAVEAASGRVVLYRLTTTRPDVEPLAALLVKITALTHEAVSALPHVRDSAQIEHLLISIHQLENESDRAYRQALQDLFDAPGLDAISIIKWKEIYDRIEIAIDKCEDVANVVESVVVKYA